LSYRRLVPERHQPVQRLPAQRGEHGRVLRLPAAHRGGGLLQAPLRLPYERLGGVRSHAEDLGGVLRIESVRQRQDLTVFGTQEGQRAPQRVGRPRRHDAVQEGAAPYALGPGKGVQPHWQFRVVARGGGRTAGDRPEGVAQRVAGLVADHDMAVGVERSGVLVIERAVRLRSTRP
jgi:hypothetical protein